MRSGSDLRVQVVSSFAELLGHRDAWLDLLGRSWSDQPTLSPLWLGPWWDVFGGMGGRQLTACLIWDGPQLLGLAPLLRRWYVPRSRIPFVRLELVGTGEPEAHEIASDYVGVIAARGAEQAVAEALAGALAGGGVGPWDELSLSALDLSVPTAARLQAALEARGLPARLEAPYGSQYIPLPQSFDAYLAALSGQGRYFVKRTLRDFETWAGARARFFRVESPADLPEGQRVLLQLHAERWRASGQDGVFASPLFKSFHQAVMPELLARGALDLRWMTVDGEPVAVIYNLVWGRRVQFYQGGRALDLPKGARPGIVLHIHAIRAAIEAGHTEYDFLAGESQYKRQMSLATRPMGRISVERPGLRRAAHAVAVRAFRWWKQRRRPPEQAKAPNPPNAEAERS